MDKGASNSFKCQAKPGTHIYKVFGRAVLTAHRNGRDSDLLVECCSGETSFCRDTDVIPCESRLTVGV